MKRTIELMLSDYIQRMGIATEKEIELVTRINGWNEETLNDIIYAVTGNHDYEGCVVDGYDRDANLDIYYGLNDADCEEDE